MTAEHLQVFAGFFFYRVIRRKSIILTTGNMDEDDIASTPLFSRESLIQPVNDGATPESHYAWKGALWC